CRLLSSVEPPRPSMVDRAGRACKETSHKQVASLWLERSYLLKSKVNSTSRLTESFVISRATDPSVKSSLSLSPFDWQEELALPLDFNLIAFPENTVGWLLFLSSNSTLVV